MDEAATIETISDDASQDAPGNAANRVNA